jgi:hypothetical protein
MCGKPISGPIAGQRGLTVLVLTLVTGMMAGDAVLDHTGGSATLRMLFALGMALLSAILVTLAILRRTPLTAFPPRFVCARDGLLVVDPAFSHTGGIRLSRNILSSGDGVFTAPVDSIQNVRVNKGYLVIYLEPAAEAREVFFNPGLDGQVIDALRQGGLGPKLIVGPWPVPGAVSERRDG